MTELTPHGPEYPHRTPRPEPRSILRRPWFLPAVVGAAALIVGLIGGIGIGVLIGAASSQALANRAAESADAEDDETRSEYFRGVLQRCGATSTAEVADGGDTLIVDNEGEDAFSGEVTYNQLDCIIDQVSTPRSTKQVMLETRSLDGRQSAEWEDEEAGIALSASWSYHPDDGLDVIFELSD